MRFLVSLLAFLSCAVGSVLAERPNVLFIAVDDLKPTLGCYGDPIAKTPNIDRLASEGTAFLKAYCQQAVCNPSRVSLLSSLRPETTEIYDLETFMRDKVPDIISLPQHFKNNGYYAERTGKIYHMGHGIDDDATSWSVTRKFGAKPRYGPAATVELGKRVAEAKKAGVPSDKLPRGLPYGAPDVGDYELRDGGFIADTRAILDAADESGKPFFAAVGFMNPHLPFVSPRKYWDLYSDEEILSQLPTFRESAKGAPEYATHSWGELRKYHEVPQKGPLTDEKERKLIHGYYAATSYVDALVGELLDELDERDLRKNTIVILWGDHGWHLGDHGIYCKHSNYEQATRVPLILSAPGQKNAGTKNEAVVEFVDVYPTLADLAGLKIPEHVEGQSLVPLLADPSAPWKDVAYHLYPRGKLMGRAVRSDRYRLVEWTDRKTGKVDAIEFYDYEKDPLETENLAKKSEYRREVAAHLQRVRQSWQGGVGTIDLPKKEDLHLYLLAGQSNMAGRGTLDEHAHKVHPRVLAMNAAGNWGHALDPLHADKTVAGVGLGKIFGETIAASNKEITVGLIPTAWGGSPIVSWEPGNAHESTKSHPWDESMIRARAAIEQGTLKGILWHQGESDANPTDAPLYKERLKTLIARFRTELNAPDLPFIIGQMALDTPKPWSEEKKLIDATHQEVASEVNNVYFVSSKGLTLRDTVHFDTKSYREFGKRYANIYLKTGE